MTLAQKLMRFISPSCEKQRMEFRESLAQVEAHTEDLVRTMRFTPEQAAAWNPSTLKK